MNSRLHNLRKTLKLSQKDFGTQLGVSRDVVNNAELGRVDMKPLFISHVCKTFNVNETWLRTGEGEMFRPVDREAELFKWVGTVLADESDSFRRRFLNLLANLTPEEWQAMERYARALVPPTDPTEP